MTTYLENFENCKRKNELLDQASIRQLTESEQEELNILVEEILIFEETILNFD